MPDQQRVPAAASCASGYLGLYRGLACDRHAHALKAGPPACTGADGACGGGHPPSLGRPHRTLLRLVAPCCALLRIVAPYCASPCGALSLAGRARSLPRTTGPGPFLTRSPALTRCRVVQSGMSVLATDLPATHTHLPMRVGRPPPSAALSTLPPGRLAPVPPSLSRALAPSSSSRLRPPPLRRLPSALSLRSLARTPPSLPPRRLRWAGCRMRRASGYSRRAHTLGARARTHPRRQGRGNETGGAAAAARVKPWPLACARVRWEPFRPEGAIPSRRTATRRSATRFDRSLPFHRFFLALLGFIASFLPVRLEGASPSRPEMPWFGAFLPGAGAVFERLTSDVRLPDTLPPSFRSTLYPFVPLSVLGT